MTTAGLQAGDSTYHPLRDRLLSEDEPEVHLSLAALDRIIPGALLPSVRRYKAWWQNDGEASHVQARSWLPR
jgi:hypothetical protein